LGTKVVDLTHADWRDRQFNKPPAPVATKLDVNEDAVLWQETWWTDKLGQCKSRADHQAIALWGSLTPALRDFVLAHVRNLPAPGDQTRSKAVVDWLDHHGTVEFIWHTIISRQAGAANNTKDRAFNAMHKVQVSADGRDADTKMSTFLSLAAKAGDLGEPGPVRIKAFLEMFAPCAALYGKIRARPKDTIPELHQGSGAALVTEWRVPIQDERAAERFNLLYAHAQTQVKAHDEALNAGVLAADQHRDTKPRQPDTRPHRSQQPRHSGDWYRHKGRDGRGRAPTHELAGVDHPAQPHAHHGPPSVAAMKDRAHTGVCLFCGGKGHTNPKCMTRVAFNQARPGEPDWNPPQEVLQILRDRRASQQARKEQLPGPPAVDQAGRKHPSQGDRQDGPSKRAKYGSGKG
jgi:hypothetical protein